MNDYDFVYTKTRRQFGKPCNFGHVPCIVLNETASNAEIANEFVSVDRRERTLDSTATYSLHSVNTVTGVTNSRGQTHFEGGWPKEIDANEPQDTLKWRKRLDKDPQFISSVSSLCSSMKKLIDQNNSIDMFEEYFVGDDSGCIEPESLECTTVALFKDKSCRQVSRISWHPEGGSKFIASYSLLKFQRMDDPNFDKVSYIWDIHHPNVPIVELCPIAPLITTQYYHRNADLVAGGNSVGRVEFFDLRVSSKSQMHSSYQVSHSDPIFDLVWLNSKTHSELVTTSPDGKVLWWDTRNLSQTTCSADGGGTCLDWQQEAGPSKYLAGSETGHCACLNKKPGKPVETLSTSSVPHFGPVVAIKRNLFHSKYFLSVGDSSVKIWLEELKAPLVQTEMAQSPLLCGGWSSLRAGMFFAGRFDGCVNFYDYSTCGLSVACCQKIGPNPITSCAANANGLFAAGDGRGVVTLLKLCDELGKGGNTEKNLVGSILEREQRRERNLIDTLKKLLLGKTDKKRQGTQINQDEYLAFEREWLDQHGFDSNTPLTINASV